MMEAVSVKKSSYVIAVPNELLEAALRRQLGKRTAEPTPDERADIQRREAERITKLGTAREQLAALTDPLARAILDLHHEDERGECAGDDFYGYEAEQPIWPCRTVETVAEHYGVELP